MAKSEASTSDGSSIEGIHRLRHQRDDPIDVSQVGVDGMARSSQGPVEVGPPAGARIGLVMSAGRERRQGVFPSVRPSAEVPM